MGGNPPRALPIVSGFARQLSGVLASAYSVAFIESLRQFASTFDLRCFQ
jgi:hypothetical protein